MKHIINVTSLFSLFFILITCQDKININIKAGNLKGKEIIYTIDSLTINIDSLSLPYNKSIQYYSDSTKKYIIYLNNNSNSIYFIDYDKKQKDFIWNKSNSNLQFDSFFLLSFDSLFLYNSNERILYLYNLEGKVLNKFSLDYKMIDDSTIYPFPYIENSLPMIKYHNDLYLTGYHVGEFGELKDSEISRKSIIKYNIQNKKFSFFLKYPNFYNKYNWGTTYNYMISATFNPRNNLIIVNFPLSHELFTYNLLNNKEMTFFAGSNLIKSILPYSKDKNKFLDSNNRLNYYLTNASYSSVFYDTYKNIYYRIAALPLNSNYIHKKGFWEKRQFTLILLNENFEYINEIFLDRLIPQNVFINESGIHIQTFSDDNIMKFKIINLKI